MVKSPINKNLPPIKHTEFDFDVGDILSNQTTILIFTEKFKKEGRGAVSKKIVPWYTLQGMSSKSSVADKHFKHKLLYTQYEIYKLIKKGWKHQSIRDG